MFINCGGFMPGSCVNGPGRRAVVWVQGCPLRCPGCFNRDLWSFRSRHVVDVEDLAGRILDIPDLEGATFSGGEPFCQARALAALGRLLQDAGLTIVTYSGYPRDALARTRRESWRALLAVTDLLVAGPFQMHRRSGGPIGGSSNQELVFLTPRLAGRGVDRGAPEEVEFVISPGGLVTATGFPDRSCTLSGSPEWEGGA